MSGQIGDNVARASGVIASAGGGANTPSFLAFLSSAQAAVTQNTWTKIAFNSELFDTDGTYDNSSNFRFTPASEAKYMLFCQVGGIPASDESKSLALRFYKNGAVYSERVFQTVNDECWRVGSGGTGWNFSHEAIVVSNDSDYWEVFAWMDMHVHTSDWNVIYDSSELITYFGAYKIII